MHTYYTHTYIVCIVYYYTYIHTYIVYYYTYTTILPYNNVVHRAAAQCARP